MARVAPRPPLHVQPIAGEGRLPRRPRWRGWHRALPLAHAANLRRETAAREASVKPPRQQAPGVAQSAHPHRIGAFRNLAFSSRLRWRGLACRAKRWGAAVPASRHSGAHRAATALDGQVRVFVISKNFRYYNRNAQSVLSPWRGQDLGIVIWKGSQDYSGMILRAIFGCARLGVA